MKKEATPSDANAHGAPEDAVSEIRSRPPPGSPVESHATTVARRLGSIPPPEAMSYDTLWRVEIFSAADETARQDVARLRSSGHVRDVYDTIDAQLRELVTKPDKSDTPDSIEQSVQDILRGRSADEYGTWAWYPWSRRLVRLLERDHFRDVRSRRNRYKITPAEQEKLRGCRIGIVGLSVGSAIAQTLALEGVGGELRLADFDRLELTNMNRIQAKVHEIGMNKAIMAARSLFELDPFLNISVFPDGITDANIDEFLMSPRPLDLVVEECDDLFTKVKVRERVRAHRIALIMETNDRGMIDIERYDLDPDTRPFHGLVGDVRADELRGMSTKDKVPFVLGILGPDTLSDRMVATLLEIEESVSSWPQLGSGVALGGALVTDCARRILLGGLAASGRYYVDLEQLIRDGAGVELALPDAVPALTSTPDVQRVELVRNNAAAGVSRAEIEEIVRYGVMAPSGGNAQSWRFVARDNVLECWVDTQRAWTFLDYKQRASHVAIGAAVENMVLAAGAMGIGAEVNVSRRHGSGDLVCVLAFYRSSSHGVSVGVLDTIRARVTNRREAPIVPLATEDRAALIAAADAASATLHLLTERPDIDGVAEVVGRVERAAFLSKRIHGEIFGEIRFSREEELRTCDGLGLDTLELSAADLAGLRLASRWGSASVLAELGLGRSIQRTRTRAARASSALGMLCMSSGEHPFFSGGRALEAVWLEATRRAVSVQPIAMPVYLLNRIEEEGANAFDAGAAHSLREGASILDNYFACPNHTRVMLFRFGYAPPPTARSLRRSWREVLS